MKSFNRLMLVMRLHLLGLQHGAQEVVEEAQSDDETENVFPSHDCPRPFRRGPTTSCNGSRRRREPTTAGGRRHPSWLSPQKFNPSSSRSALPFESPFLSEYAA